MSTLFMLGKRSPILGADAFTAAQLAGSPEMTPAQLADLDRKLSPAEQDRVDRFQAGQADALQKKEESTPYVDPQTGQKRDAVVKYVPGADAPPPAASAPIWKKVVFALLTGGAVFGVSLSLRSHK